MILLTQVDGNSLGKSLWHFSLNWMEYYMHKSVKRGGKKMCQSLVGSFGTVLEYKKQGDTGDYMNRSKISWNEKDSNNPNS